MLNGAQPRYTRLTRSFLPEYIWRAFNCSQMDFQAAFTQMVYLCYKPSDVYKTTKFRKQIKNQWARDDPAFVVLTMLFITLASLAYSISFGSTSLAHFIRVVLGSVFIEFLAIGCLVATILQYLANRYMNAGRVMSTRQDVEWLYAFDIHCNGFFPLFVMLYVVQYFLSPLLISEKFVATLVANTLYAFAFCYYWHITWLGYSILPFLQNTQRFMQPTLLVLLLYLVSLLTNFNVAIATLTFYFGKD